MQVFFTMWEKFLKEPGVKSKYINDEKIKSLLTKGYGYLHALFTQEFFEREIEGKSIEHIFKSFGNPLFNGEEEDSITNISAKHHNPSSAYQ